MSEPTREDVFVQLRGMINELRLLTPPYPGVQSCVGGSLHDSRIPHGNPRFGPFKTIRDFHFWLRHDFRMQDVKDRGRDQDYYDLEEVIEKQDGPWPLPKFTHRDLHPFNILVRNGKVVGIIDWEFAGWCPDYWEYTSAWSGNRIRTDWQASLNKFLERPSEEVLKVEEVRNKWWGEF